MAESLLERARRATGPDRELDATLHMEFVEDADLIKEPSGRLIAKSRHAPFHDWVVFAGSHPPPTYTASLDATVALVERVRPSVGWSITSASDAEVDDALERGATPPLALLSALLASLEPSTETEG